MFSVLADLVDLGSGSEKFECRLPNPGRLKVLLVSGVELLLWPAKNPNRRKTMFDVFAVVADSGTVVVDSQVANQIRQTKLDQDRSHRHK